MQLLESAIREGRIDQAMSICRCITHYSDAKEHAQAILGHEDSPHELIDRILEIFCNSRINQTPQHGKWIESFCHFSRELWKRRLVHWIAYCYKLSLGGANELFNFHGCHRIVSDFVLYSNWDDDPAMFHLQPKNLIWMQWKNHSYAKARIDAGLFKSEEDFLRWKIKRPEIYRRYNFDLNMLLIDLNNSSGIKEKLQKMGVDVGEFTAFEKQLLTEQLETLDAKLYKNKDVRRRREFEREIKRTLDELSCRD